MTGDAELDRMIAKVRKIGEMPQDLALELSQVILADVKRTAAAGTTHEGKPWPSTKEGGQALVHSPDHLTARILGTVVQIVLTGVDVIHNRGTKRMPRRRILPDAGAGLPARVAELAKKTAGAAFAKIVGGA
jgi:hypothetical protein